MSNLKLDRPQWGPFKDSSKFTVSGPTTLKQNADRMYANNWFYVFCFYGKSVLGMPATKVLISKADKRAEFTQTVMKRVKLSIFGPDTKAIYYFGPDAEHSHEPDIYCMWVLQ